MKAFRLVAFLEGISLILLMGIAMPMKHLMGQPQMVRVVGWIHGILFIAYVCLLAAVSVEEKWPWKKKVWAFVASLLPFGTFVFDRKYLSSVAKAVVAVLMLWPAMGHAKSWKLIGACHFEKKDINCFEYYTTPSGLMNTKLKDGKEVCEKTGGKFVDKVCDKKDAIGDCKIHQPKDGAKKPFYIIYFRRQPNTDVAAQHKMNEQLCGNIGKMGRSESIYKKY